MNERVNEGISRSIFNATRTGNGFNKIMSTGNGFIKYKLRIFSPPGPPGRKGKYCLKQIEFAFG